MNVIARKKLIDFAAKYPDARNALERWWTICRKNSYSSFSDLKRTFGTADMVNRCIVFDIGGGKYRLVARVNFVGKRMWVKYLLTHEEYDKLNLKEDTKCLP
jgi:mRNA interferase HigB